MNKNRVKNVVIALTLIGVGSIYVGNNVFARTSTVDTFDGRQTIEKYAGDTGMYEFFGNTNVQLRNEDYNAYGTQIDPDSPVNPRSVEGGELSNQVLSNLQNNAGTRIRNVLSNAGARQNVTNAINYNSAAISGSLAEFQSILQQYGQDTTKINAENGTISNETLQALNDANQVATEKNESIDSILNNSKEELFNRIKNGEMKVISHDKIIINMHANTNFTSDARKRTFANKVKEIFGLSNDAYQNILSNLNRNSGSFTLYEGDESSPTTIQNIFKFENWLTDWLVVEYNRTIEFIPNDIPQDRKTGFIQLLGNIFNIDYSTAYREVNKDSNDTTRLTAIETVKTMESDTADAKVDLFGRYLEKMKLEDKVSVQEYSKTESIEVYESNSKYQSSDKGYLISFVETRRDMLLDDVKGIFWIEGSTGNDYRHHRRFPLRYLKDADIRRVLSSQDLLLLGIDKYSPIIEEYWEDDGDSGGHLTYGLKYSEAQCENMVIQALRTPGSSIYNLLDVETHTYYDDEGGSTDVDYICANGYRFYSSVHEGYSVKLKDLTDEGIRWIINCLSDTKNLQSKIDEARRNYPTDDYLSKTTSIVNDNSKNSTDVIDIYRERQVRNTKISIMNNVADNYKNQFAQAKQEVVNQIKNIIRNSAINNNVNISESTINEIGDYYLECYISDEEFESYVKQILQESGIPDLYDYIDNSTQVADLNMRWTRFNACLSRK